MLQSENRFRNGYLFELERMIMEKFLPLTLKAIPNIEFLVKLLRRWTIAVAHLVCISGFIWNHENNTMECEKSAFDEYVKVIIIKFANYVKGDVDFLFYCNVESQKAAGLYKKSFPFINDLTPVITKDRAHSNARVV